MTDQQRTPKQPDRPGDKTNRSDEPKNPADAFRERLRRENRMKDFKVRVQALRDGGHSPGDSWQTAAKEFGFGTGPGEQEAPKPIAPNAHVPTADPEEFEAMLHRTSGQQGNLEDDVRWAYENLENPTITLEDAPSAGAWSYLQFARSNRTNFMSNIVPKFLGKASPGEDADDGDPDFERFHKLMSQFRREPTDQFGRPAHQIEHITRKFCCPACSTPLVLPAPHSNDGGEAIYPDVEIDDLTIDRNQQLPQ
jgi:hypothetical protein